MAREIQLPCNGEGVCMRCKVTPQTEETLVCITCATPWHMSCLSSESFIASEEWMCPDCFGPTPVSGNFGVQSSESNLVAAIRAIESDESLTDAQKAKKRQKLMTGQADDGDDDKVVVNEPNGADDDVLAVVRETFSCSICIQLPERPVTTPCGHNFCLKCYEKWMRQGKFTCVKCRRKIPKKAAMNPRINLSLVTAIRLARESKSTTEVTSKFHHYISNQDRPNQAFTTKNAVKPGLANASSGKIFVTIPPDHFGPIPAENDPTRNLGVLVGESWKGRHESRQWVHFPIIGGIAGQSKYGAQSVILSGGYDDDEDHGEWFLYTGSGGRDLSNNRRTNKKHTHDQNFTKMNEALRLSCKMGYPVRVIRSYNERRSAYAPVEKLEVRYDGIYRVEMCWRKIGIQGPFMVCRYLFVRCDNEPAPWNSGEQGDRPRPLPDVPELEVATDLFVRTESPSWDFDEADSCWKWIKPPPASRKALATLESKGKKRVRKSNMSIRVKLLKEFSCQICWKVMSFPVTTPCGHNFCKGCLKDKFSGITQMRDRSRGGRSLRARKNIMNCPCCPRDISDCLQNPEVNRDMMDVIEKLTKKDEVLAVDNEEAQIKEGEAEKPANSGENITASENEEEEEGEEEGDQEDEEEDNEEEGMQNVESEAEELPSKKVKLDTETIAAATVLESKVTDTVAAATVLEITDTGAEATATVLEESKDTNTEATATVLDN